MGEGSGGRSAYCLINLRRIKGAALLSDRQDGGYWPTLLTSGRF
jgi:hypothetical protein